MTEKKIDSRLKNIIGDLSSPDLKVVFTALKQLRKHGKRQAISPLIELLHSSDNEDLKNEIASILFDLKDQGVVEDIVIAIEDDKYEEERHILISIFWQSALDSSEYISSIVRQAIKGNYLIGIEVLSVIDSYEATFQEVEIEDLKFDLDEAIETEEPEKSNLLKSIRSAMDSLNLEF
jgi:HEAT repeat protein